MKWAFACMILVPVAAQAGTQMAVIAYGTCRDDVAGRNARALRALLADRGDATLLSDEATLSLLGGIPRGSFADAERALAGARSDFFQDATARAERGLQSAADDLLRLAPTESRWKALREATLLLSWLELKAGKKSAAEGHARQILIVEPTHVPDPNVFPPSFRAFVEGIKVRLRKEGPKTGGRLTITTQPTGKAVYVNGCPIGISPQKLQVPKGEHLVEVDFGGPRGLPKRVNVGADTQVSLAEAFEGSVFVDGGPCLKTTDGREGSLVAIVRLASLLGVASVAAVKHEVLTTGEQYLVATVVDSHSGQELREAKVRIFAAGTPPGVLDRLADFVATGAFSPPLERAARTAPADTPKQAQLIPSAAPVSAPPSVDFKDAGRLRPSVLVSGGVAIASGVTAAVFLLRANAAANSLNQSRTARGTFGPESEGLYAERAGEISTGQTIALSAGVVAVAGAATSLILALRGGAPKDEDAEPVGAK